ncbi:cell division protein ZapB [uncultured Desulfuromonas sp.]|uniref:cell division protein ZapB n=1 Tax=uncultured Desulfuromonas sp. TaxID=181013 RepID=UPI0026293249|nr:cell division protein ZapB [uncultured Desulfuromonas sp.]
MDLELVLQLERKVDRLLERKEGLEKTCQRLQAEKASLEKDRERFRAELDRILGKLDCLDREAL